MEKQVPIHWHQVKAFAREAYRDNKKTLWIAAFVQLGIVFITEIALDFLNNMAVGRPNESLIQILTLLISILVTAPLTFGMFELLIRLLRKEEGKARDVFSWFTSGKSLRTSVIAMLWYFCLSFFWLVVYLIPGLLVAVWLNTDMGTFAIIVLMVFYLAKIITYIPGLFLIAEGKNPVYQSFQIAKYIMTPYKWNFLLFIFSFILYYLPLLGFIYIVSIFTAYFKVAVALVVVFAYLIFFVPYFYLCLIRYFQEVSLKMAEQKDGIVQVERQDVPLDQVPPQEEPDGKDLRTETDTDADSSENKVSGVEMPNTDPDNHKNN